MSRKYYFINNPDNIMPEGICSSILKKSDALTFHMEQNDYSPTPLITLPALAGKYGLSQIFVKDESHRLGLDSFKGVGAYYAVSKLLSENNNIITLCTATDGNHGRALAWSARQFGKEAVVLVPHDISDARICAIEDEGARVLKTGKTYDETCILAAEISKENNWTLVQDTAFIGYEEIPAHIMAGYLTIFKELENTINSSPEPGFDIIFLQAGVGSFAASAIWYYIKRYGNNRPKIVITEPVNADGIFYSFEKNCLSRSPSSSDTIMAGLNCNTPSLGAWDIIKHGADISIKLEDKNAIMAMRELYYPTGNDSRIIAGESGAAGLAGLLAILKDRKYESLIDQLNVNNNTRVLVINTEGLTDRENFNKFIGR